MTMPAGTPVSVFMVSPSWVSKKYLYTSQPTTSNISSTIIQPQLDRFLGSMFISAIVLFWLDQSGYTV